ncbi:hypothetical protein C8R46DRAFT_1224097 [Mycena filopes]|nr:hypothetical protein C8R46DRAFT_1224097 [Mycena filopes]
MSTPPPDQTRANDFLRDLVAMDKGDLGVERHHCSYHWPRSIQYENVSSPVRNNIRQFLPANTGSDTRPFGQRSMPETPQSKKIARELDVAITAAPHQRAKRVLRAQELEEALKLDLELVYDFLRAAREREVHFPRGEETIVATITRIRESLDEIERMVRRIPDSGATDAGTDTEDFGDTTAVA